MGTNRALARVYLKLYLKGGGVKMSSAEISLHPPEMQSLPGNGVMSTRAGRRLLLLWLPQYSLVQHLEATRVHHPVSVRNTNHNPSDWVFFAVHV